MSRVDNLLLILADGVRPDVLAAAIDRGDLPSLAALRDRGGLHEVTTSFPSVTGPAYLPILMGRHPAPLGMPGLRWYDRSRSIRRSIGNSRSYSGVDIWRTNDDVPPDAPTLFELAAPSLAAMSIFSRGATYGNVGRSVGYMIRSVVPHFTGNAYGWRNIEQTAVREFLRRFEERRPRFGFLAINTPDKLAHRYGTFSAEFDSSLRDVDAAVAQAELIASRGKWRDRLAIWIVADHGHSTVHRHDDLHAWLEALGHRIVAHPRLRTRNADIALMVGGNAMAHLYVDPEIRTRGKWDFAARSANALLEKLLQRASTDIVVLNDSTSRVVVQSRNGTAEIVMSELDGKERFSYRLLDGDPLGTGVSAESLDAGEAWKLTSTTRYPDSIVQLARIATATRSGDIIVSASEGWDLRERYESVPHKSTHGALLREHMMVPLLVDRPVSRTPQRTADVFPSALELLGLPGHRHTEGESFI